MASHLYQMKKNKKATSAYIKEECCRSGPPRQLNEILDFILDPRKAVGQNDDSRDAIEWCRWLVAGGRTPDEFFSTVRAYDNATTCGLVWTANFVAYRCRTCGISPCMSLCAECFQRGNHEGHDFNMFRSQAGGACDCGDTSVMKESGFCQKHGPKSQMEKPAAPMDLFCITEVVLPRVVLRLVQHLRERYKPYSTEGCLEAIEDADSLLTMLHQLSTLGAAMRHVMTQSLTNPQIYKNLTDEFLARSEDKELQLHMSESFSKYTEALKSVRTPDPRDDGANFPTLQNNLIHRTFLDELVFWTVKYEFPQKLVCFLLNMLPDNNYKEAFTRAFIRHYSRISDMLMKSGDYETLSNRVVHVSVQLFSNEALAQQMSEELHLLHVMVISLKDMMRDILIPSLLHRAKKNFHHVVDCKEHVMKNHCYWSLVSDLNNVLSHKSLVMKFLSDTSLLEMWFDFLSMFQGMNVNQRELLQHVKFESNTYYAAFSAELEASASIMWAMIAHLNDSSTLHLTKQVISYCTSALQDWFDALGFPETDVLDSLQVSFHLPLHRYLSVFINQAIRHQGERLENILPPPEMLKNLIVHPLKAQVAFYEILCGMWVRNGLQMKGQAMTYIQCHFCNSMMDADLFMLQLCATHLDPDWFITTVLERFHVFNWFSLQNTHTIALMDTEHEMPMLEGALTFLAMLFTVHTNIGLQEEDLTRLEMITLLSMGDKTHSQLMDLMPEKCGSVLQNKDFEATLARTGISGLYTRVVLRYRLERWSDPVAGETRKCLHNCCVRDLTRSAKRVEANGENGKGLLFARKSHFCPQVADYKAPNFEVSGNMLQGMYVPKSEVWEHDYDPIYVLLRAVHRRDFQASMDRFTQFARQTTKTTGNFWPPFRIPNPVHPMFVDPRKLLHCRTMHGILFTILYKSLHDPTVSDLTVSLCVYLIDLAVRFPAAESLSGKELLHLSKPNEEELLDLHFKDWFNSSFLLTNLSQKISKVLLPHPGNGESERMEVDNYDMGVTEISSMVDGPLYDMSHEGAAEQLAALASSAVHLPLPASETSQALVPVAESSMMMVQQVEPMNMTLSTAQAPPADPQPLVTLTHQSLALVHPPRFLSGPASQYVPGAIPLPPPPPIPGQLSTTRRRGWSPMTRDVVRRALLLPHMFHQRQMEEMEKQAKKFSIESMLALQHSNYVNVDESMLSLLLKLHSKLSGRLNTYVPVGSRPSTSSQTPPTESRIGDGPHFIGLLLDKISQLSIRNARSITEICQTLWPKQPEDAGSSGAGNAYGSQDVSDKEDRRRRARERQQRLMAEFASQQKAFMEQSKDGENEDDGISDMSSENMEDNIYNYSKEYDCAICGQTSPSREDKPIGMVCLLQASSVLGNAYSDEKELVLPCTNETSSHRGLGDRRAFFMTKRIQELGENFDDISRLMSVNIGWEGGIHVRTCGHYLHLDCHKSYIISLKNQHNQRQQSLAVDKGEYSCPLCRQLANTVLPITPDIGAIAAVVKSKRDDQRVLATELLHLINSEPPTPEKTSNLMEAMGSIVEDMVNVTYPQYMVYTVTQRPESMFLFMTSVARTNLELDVIQRGGSLCPVPSNVPPRPCLVPLLHVLGMHLKILAIKPHSQLWPQITGLQMEENLSSISCCEKEVPLLLRDMSALLLQLILLLPMHIDKAYFSCIVRMLYNIVYIQAVAMLSSKMSEQERLYWKEKGKQDSTSLTSMVSVMGEVIDTLEHCALYLQDDDMDRNARLKKWTLFELQSEIREMCIPFLRVASLLQHHIHKEELPIFTQKEQEYDYLSWFLGLHENHLAFTAAVDGTLQGYYSTALLTWITDDPRWVLRNWCQDFIAFVNVAQIASRNLLHQNKIWHRPHLLRLPQRYDQIFQHYHQKACQNCRHVPKEPSICLVCGTIICLRGNCCRKDDMGEAVQHSIKCGSGTAMFLAINLSSIFVIRGKRACLWGSVYLDSYGEEDRELKRGKPLFLHKDRYQLLEHQWLTHSFDHTNKRWSWHKDNL